MFLALRGLLRAHGKPGLTESVVWVKYMTIPHSITR